MDELLEAIAALVSLVSSEKVEAIASRVRRADAANAAVTLHGLMGTPVANALLEQLATTWKNTKISPDELASMLLAASYVYTKVASEQSTELVWTGPTTPFVSARRTEQALLQVINSAEHSLIITSFVAYNVSTIVKAMNSANDRGVVISMLLELPQEHGGNISFDAIGRMKNLVPTARLYAWEEKDDKFSGGSVHAKVAVADGRVCFITSANLTGHAMEKNMEAGVLISGGQIPKLLDGHLTSLFHTNLVARV